VKKRGKEIDYQAKTVTLAGRRYIVCRNHQEAEKDAADRTAIVAALERQLAKGDKALVSNTGFRRYLKTISDEHFAIDPDKIEEEKKFDGIFVLRTNTDLNPLEAMLCYKQLWMVDIDQAWRLSRLCEGRGRSGLIWRRQTPPWERGCADCLQGYDRRVVGMDEDGMTGAHSYKAAA
jgi:hypothetical protein